MENNNFRLNLIKGVQLIGRKLDGNGNVLAVRLMYENCVNFRKFKR